MLMNLENWLEVFVSDKHKGKLTYEDILRIRKILRELEAIDPQKCSPYANCTRNAPISPLRLDFALALSEEKLNELVSKGHDIKVN